MSGAYQVLMLGSYDSRRDRLRSLLSKSLAELGLEQTVIRFIDEEEAEARDPRSPLMAVFFGSSAHVEDTLLINELLQDSIVIAPLVTSVERVHLEIPPQLRHVNVLAPGPGDNIGRLTTLVLETFRLLRRERRLFISYRRVDAQPFAERLYDSLDARGFDVFIDVRSVPPAVDFQSELWHRMSDSDVVVLIDTPGFRESRWTTAELARANSTNIQILHLLWPGQKEDGSSSFSHFMKLDRSDFWGWVPGRGRWVRENTLDRIYEKAEQLRARAIAARYRYLIDNFCDAARDLAMDPAVQPEQWISLQRDGRMTLAVVPAVGVPTSNRIHEIFSAVAASPLKPDEVWIVYDNRGILKTWLAHLDWLDKHLPLRTIRMSSAPDLLRGLTA
jgi:hypothetical protein